MRHTRGIKDLLKSDVDIALAMHNKEQQLTWANISMVKVKSHIPIEEATNEFFWEANDTTDQLATKARQKEVQERYPASPPVMLTGTIAGCYIEGQLHNNNLHTQN